MTTPYPHLLSPLDLGFTTRALSAAGVERQIRAFVRAGALAREAGYDGVEVMGSEGYFVNEFLVTRTDKRKDRWGDSTENRMRLPVEIVSRLREAVGRDFIIVYRISMLDLKLCAAAHNFSVHNLVRPSRLATAAPFVSVALDRYELRNPVSLTRLR